MNIYRASNVSRNVSSSLYPLFKQLQLVCFPCSRWVNQLRFRESNLPKITKLGNERTGFWAWISCLRTPYCCLWECWIITSLCDSSALNQMKNIHRRKISIAAKRSAPESWNSRAKWTFPSITGVAAVFWLHPLACPSELKHKVGAERKRKQSKKEKRKKK